MQVERRNQWTVGDFTLTAREFDQKEQNPVYKISLLASDHLSISHLPISEIRELPNWDQVVHVINDKHLQKLIQKFHRYGPLNILSDKMCPFQAGAVREKYVALVGPHNLVTQYEEESTVARSHLLSFFTKEKLKSLETSWRGITKEWLAKQIALEKVLLFDAAHVLVGECLIRGILGYEECSEEDLRFNVEFWKTLLSPLNCELKSAKEYESEGKPGLFGNIWNLVQSGPEIAEKVYAYHVKSSDLNQLAEKIYQASCLNKTSLVFHLIDKNWSNEDILESIKGFLIAGQETVAYFLGFILYEYAKNQEMQKRHAEAPSEIKNAFLEALRLYSVGGAQREAGQDLVVSCPDGKEHYIRKGDMLVCEPYLAGHTQEWENPEIFDASREDLYHVKETPHFGSGAHRCIGEKAAEVEILSILEEILSQATLTTESTLPDLLYGFTLRPKHDLYIQFNTK